MILDEIVEQKKIEVSILKNTNSIGNMRQQLAGMPPARSLVGALQKLDGKMGIIAEVKKGSPSKGIIRPDLDPAEVAEAYTTGGATAISVLTDEKFFFGGADNLKAVRTVTDLPILRKDFIIDPIQIYESRLMGADLILLIAAILDDGQIEEFLSLAGELGLEALVEVHTVEELERVKGMPVQLLGINNRDLKTFKTDLGTSLRLVESLKDSGVKIISESGINTAADVKLLQDARIHGILVGEALMRERDVGTKLRELRAGKGVA